MGVHVSVAGGLDRAVDRAAEIGCDVFQIFSRNPRGWQSRDISSDEAERFLAKMKASGISVAFDHMSYLPNLASPKEEVYSRSVEALSSELQRCHSLGIPYLVTHLGSHLGSGRAAGLHRIVKAIETAFSASSGQVILLLENTSGTKNSMGSSFEEIAEILDALESMSVDRARLGICLDTCHLFAAGYELRTQKGLDETLKQFDDALGLDRLRLLHLNDSRGAIGSRLDRHEHIGLGEIGMLGFMAILQNKDLRDLPMILETPVDGRRDDAGNLRIARSLASV
jgi:deoxyribonuclease-4